MRKLFMTIRISPKERKVIELLSVREDRNSSEMLRELIREGAERRGIQAVGLVDLQSTEGRQDDKQ